MARWSRVVMDQETKQLISQIAPQPKNVLEISGDKWKDYGFERYLNAGYPTFDICSKTLPEEFDLIIAEQVWEHLKYPYRATKNVVSMLHKGGYFLVTVPFLVKYHPCPIDCTRWSEEGLKYFLEECGFDVNSIKSGSWGNWDCVVDNLSGWKSYIPEKHSLKNQSDFPYHVWALARVPSKK